MPLGLPLLAARRRRRVAVVLAGGLLLSGCVSTTDHGNTSPPTATGSSNGSSTPAPGVLSIRVSGNRLVDGVGEPVQLRGVNRSGTQYACAEGWGIFDGPSSNASLDAMRAWGVNAVRVNGNEDCWLGINGVKAAYSGPNYINALVDYVHRINARGMYVIVDLHHSAPGTQLASGQQAMADRDHSDAYWASVAATFKDDPAVLFDLYNEPHPDSNRDSSAAWACVRDGGACPGVSFTAAGSQEMLTAVRGAGARNVVLVGGPQYAGDLDRWAQYAPVDPLHQLAASIHIYYQTPADPEWAPCDYLSCWTTTMAPLAASTPVVIGEFGEHDCNTDLIDGTALSPQQPSLLDWADEHGVSYLAWSWFTGNCTGEPALISSYDGTSTSYGAGVRAHYLQRAG
jgi:endoglucanase